MFIDKYTLFIHKMCHPEDKASDGSINSRISVTTIFYNGEMSMKIDTNIVLMPSSKWKLRKVIISKDTLICM